MNEEVMREVFERVRDNQMSFEEFSNWVDNLREDAYSRGQDNMQESLYM